MSFTKAAVGITLFGIASEILYRWYKRIMLSPDKKNGRFIFFPDKGILQRNFDHDMNSNNTRIKKSLSFNESSINNNNGAEVCSKNILATSTSLIHLIDVIDSAQQTLVVCVMAITCTQLADAIIRAKKRGVNVRVVVDSTMVDIKGCQLLKLRSNHILTFSMSCPGGLMHNKFAVVDAHVAPNSNSSKKLDGYNLGAKSLSKSSRGTAMSGSFNWTWTGVICNEENVYISSDAEFVNPLADRFENIWKKLLVL